MASATFEYHQDPADPFLQDVRDYRSRGFRFVEGVGVNRRRVLLCSKLFLRYGKQRGGISVYRRGASICYTQRIRVSPQPHRAQSARINLSEAGE